MCQAGQRLESDGQPLVARPRVTIGHEPDAARVVVAKHLYLAGIKRHHTSERDTSGRTAESAHC
jgi:hypothetical protein